MLLQLEEKDFPHLFNLHVVFSILYLGVFATALAFFLWNKGMQYVDAGVGSIFTFFNVIAGGILGWLILGETLTWNFFAGGILVLAATIMMLMNNRLHNVDEEKIRESRLDENS
jgi:drug/metabolite transporter (DMT)-like permease